MKTLQIKPTARKGRKHGPHHLRFPGIVDDARQLQTNRTHLYLCLTGQRVSHSLVRRYRELKASQKGGRK